MLRPLAACCEAFGAACNWLGEHMLWPLFNALSTAVGAIGRLVGRVVGARRPEPDGPNLATTTLT